MSRWLKYMWVAVIFIGTAAPPAPGQVRSQLHVGARPMGMGETFIGIADDANTLYWNPAGLPQLQRQEFTFI